MKQNTQQEISHLHEQLVHIAQQCSRTANSPYTADDLRKIQNKLHHIDEKYLDCVLHNPSEQTSEGRLEDPFEVPGEAQLANEISIVHDAITAMLRNLE
ncbi:unnamed protein product [Cunninghamella blakesleeana]